MFWFTFSLSVALPNANSNLLLCLVRSVFPPSQLCYLFLHHKLPPNLTACNDRLTVSIGQKPRSSLVEWFWARSSPEATVKVFFQAAVIWDLARESSASKLTHSIFSRLFFTTRAFPPGCLSMRKLASPTEWSRREWERLNDLPRWKLQSFYSLTLKATSIISAVFNSLEESH